MTKQVRKKQKPGTHFEQVPIAVVKKVAVEIDSNHGKTAREPAAANSHGVPARATQRTRR